MHTSDTRSEASEDEIAVCAYFIWEQEGKPVGRALRADHYTSPKKPDAFIELAYGVRR